MKQLFIIRHAKSSWDIGVLNDFDRTLNNRGHRDAPIMANKLLDRNINIDLFVSSTAKRAFTTATYFAEAYKKTENDILKVSELYHAMPNIFFKTISDFNDNYNSAAVFSHNPGITDFVNELTKTQIDDMPTCSIFAIKINTNTWSNFAKAG
ncbi:MAG: SixA phosphatase family protein, partial [Chitinophagaceae bacterium]